MTKQYYIANSNYADSELNTNTDIFYGLLVLLCVVAVIVFIFNYFLNYKISITTILILLIFILLFKNFLD